MKFFLFLIIFTASAATPPSLGEPETIWSKNEVRVCFADPHHLSQTQLAFSRTIPNLGSYDQNQKKIITETIQKNYSLTETAFVFTGFRDCNDDPAADAYILKAEDENFVGGQASMGENGGYFCDDEEFTSCRYLKRHNGQKPMVVINFVDRERKISADERLALTALHEFGHLAGLVHEHARPEAMKDPKCSIPEFKESLGEETEILSTTRYGAYDTNSIMSYCHIYNILFHTGAVTPIELSSGDKATLRALYQKKRLPKEPSN